MLDSLQDARARCKDVRGCHYHDDDQRQADAGKMGAEYVIDARGNLGDAETQGSSNAADERKNANAVDHFAQRTVGFFADQRVKTGADLEFLLAVHDDERAADSRGRIDCIGVKRPVQECIFQRAFCCFLRGAFVAREYRGSNVVCQRLGNAVERNADCHARAKYDSEPGTEFHLGFCIFSAEFDVARFRESGPEAEDKKNGCADCIEPSEVGGKEFQRFGCARAECLGDCDAGNDRNKNERRGQNKGRHIKDLDRIAA